MHVFPLFSSIQKVTNFSNFLIFLLRYDACGLQNWSDHEIQQNPYSSQSGNNFELIEIWQTGTVGTAASGTIGTVS